jgi:hypothetical protein
MRRCRSARIAGEKVIVENRGDKPVPVFATAEPTEVQPGQSFEITNHKA